MAKLNMSPSAERRLAMSHIRSQVAKAGGPDSVKKDALVGYAEKLGITVTRQDGGDGDPTKADYLKALGF